jgi:hypothetical protein
MSYQTPSAGTVLPAKKNETMLNPGPVHDPYGNTEYLQVDAQDKAYIANETLKTDYTNRLADSPEYAAELGAANSWGVVVIAAEAGGVAFDQQRVGPAVKTL